MKNSIKIMTIKGPASLEGSIELQGSKNSALSLIPTLLLSNNPSTLKRVPDLIDIRLMLSYLQSIGVKFSFSNNCLKLYPQISNESIDSFNTNLTKIRVGYYLIPFLLKQLGYAIIPDPGGCNLGDRKSNYIFEALVKFGADVTKKNNCILVKAEQLKGVEYNLPYPSQSASTVLLSLASIAKGISIIKNLSLNPEIEDKLCLLEKMGVSIEKIGERDVKVTGTEELRNTDYEVMPDRIAAASWLSLSAVNNSKLIMSADIERYLQTEIHYFEQIGLKRKDKPDNQVEYSFNGNAKPIDITTGAYPEFNTDIQPLAMAMCVAQKAIGSIITEMVFDKRFNYVHFFNKMGCKIRVEKITDKRCPNGCQAHRAKLLHVPEKLSAQKVKATDLRAGMSMILMGFLAEGTTQIENAYQIFRGYENVDVTLKSLGASIELKTE